MSEVFLVTRGAGGIGAAVARRFAGRGRAGGAPPAHEGLIAYGPLLSDDGATGLGTAALLQAADATAARALLPAHLYADIEVHPWRFGGRPT